MARLRIERIAVASRQFDARRATRTLNMRDLYPGGADHDLAIGRLFRAHGRAIGLRFDRNRCEFRFRPQPLRRKHRLGKVEAEELVGAVLVRHRGYERYQKPRAKGDGKSSFQDHLRPPEMIKNRTAIMYAAHGAMPTDIARKVTG